MTAPLDSSLGIVAYLALFIGVGFLFVFVNLLIGRFLRSSDPHPEKLETYECGEPAIGSSFVQFDLRFYVVALVFIIFDVEVAFLFPWATVFGKATNLAELTRTPAATLVEGDGPGWQLTRAAAGLYRELGVRDPAAPRVESGSRAEAEANISHAAQQLKGLALVAALLFFVVLLIGFAYEWKTGALDWVRAIAQERGLTTSRASPTVAPAAETALSI